MGPETLVVFPVGVLHRTNMIDVPVFNCSREWNCRSEIPQTKLPFISTLLHRFLSGNPIAPVGPDITAGRFGGFGKPLQSIDKHLSKSIRIKLFVCQVKK